ncbi:hypothetical protein Hanom_Chr12g01098941 [Helianthus anomalus]
MTARTWLSTQLRFCTKMHPFTPTQLNSNQKSMIYVPVISLSIFILFALCASCKLLLIRCDEEEEESC